MVEYRRDRLYGRTLRLTQNEGVAVKNAILYNGMTQKYLARKLRITDPRLSMYLSGKMPIPQPHAAKLFRLLGKSPYLTFLAETPNEKDLSWRTAYRELGELYPQLAEADRNALSEEIIELLKKYKPATDTEAAG